MTIDLILGTAGHIDHGKTTLIKSLTGVDTDRLPEEKRRGITIELGFAELDLGEYRLGIVDVPGHERFVRQMLAGATGMDIGLLVVAADDSVKPQTREHVDVLRLLDLPAGVIALTKADLADEDWMGLVEEEIRELVRGTCFERAELVRTSAVTGMGLDRLREALRRAAEQAVPRSRARRDLPFRMPIDRSFTIAGHGTVVTGSVASGRVAVGETLLLEPGGRDVRVRGLRNHDRMVEEVHAGQRAAINLAGVHHEQIQRGHELGAAGFLAPSRLVTATLEVLEHSPRTLKRRDRVRVHLGTAEILASVVPLGCDGLAPGQRGFVQLYLQEPVVCSWLQPFVVRSESPIATIGGGSVLVPAATKLRRAADEVLQQLARLVDGDEPTRAAAAIYFAAKPLQSPTDLVRIAGVESPQAVYEQLVADKTLQLLTLSGHRQLTIHRQQMAEYADRIAGLLAKWHDRAPLNSGFDRSALIQEFRYLGDATVVQAVLHLMERSGRIRATERHVGLADRGPQLSKGERQLLEQILANYLAAGTQPPTVKECEQAAAKNQKSVRSLIALAATDGLLVEFGDQLYLHADVEASVRQTLSEALRGGAARTVSEIRELLGTTRKFAVPLCEYLDRIRFTVREGDQRRLAAPHPPESEPTSAAAPAPGPFPAQ